MSSSFRQPGFDSQHPRGDSQPLQFHLPRTSALVRPAWTLDIYSAIYIYAYVSYHEMTEEPECSFPSWSKILRFWSCPIWNGFSRCISSHILSISDLFISPYRGVWTLQTVGRLFCQRNNNKKVSQHTEYGWNILAFKIFLSHNWLSPWVWSLQIQRPTAHWVYSIVHLYSCAMFSRVRWVYSGFTVYSCSVRILKQGPPGQLFHKRYSSVYSSR